VRRVVDGFWGSQERAVLYDGSETNSWTLGYHKFPCFPLSSLLVSGFNFCDVLTVTAVCMDRSRYLFYLSGDTTCCHPPPRFHDSWVHLYLSVFVSLHPSRLRRGPASSHRWRVLPRLWTWGKWSSCAIRQRHRAVDLVPPAAHGTKREEARDRNKAKRK